MIFYMICKYVVTTCSLLGINYFQPLFFLLTVSVLSSKLKEKRFLILYVQYQRHSKYSNRYFLVLFHSSFSSSVKSERDFSRYRLNPSHIVSRLWFHSCLACSSFSILPSSAIFVSTLGIHMLFLESRLFWAE